MTDFRSAGIEAASRSGTDPTALVAGEFDAIVVNPSWDSRCLSIAEAVDVSAALGVCSLFSNHGTLGLRDKHDRLVLAWLADKAQRVERVEGPSEDLSDMWKRMIGPLVELMQARNRPLKVLIDLSTCPRYYAAGFLSTGLERGIFSNVTFFYAEAAYPITRVLQRPQSFTRGRWNSVPVPDRLGTYSPTKKRFYLVSVGFEGAKTFTAVSRADPDRVALLFPKPGFRPEYEELCDRQSDQLRDEYLIPPELVVEAPAGDMVAAWRQLTEDAIERPDEENIFYLCSGTKPHTLALTLRAYALGSPAVLYNRPQTHVESETRPSGTFWTYEIRDRTAAV
jgi:hypothetical protein